MTIVYNLNQSDMDNMSAKGVTLTANGVPVDTGYGLSTDDTLVATCSQGKIFYIPPVDPWFAYPTSSVNFLGWDSSEYVDTYVSFELSADKKTATLKPPVGRVYSTFNVDTQDLTANNTEQDITVSDEQAKLLYTLTQEDIDAIAINQIDYKINGVTAILGSQLRLGDVCVAKVTGNRKFYIEETYPNATSIHHFCYDDSWNTVYLNYVFSDNDQTATFTVVDNSGTISGYGFYSFIVSTRIETPAVVGKNNSAKLLYTLTQEDIDAIAINQIDYKINGVTAILGSQLRLGDVCVAKVTGNRKFYIEETYPNATSIHHFCYDDSWNTVYLNYVFSDNDQTATFTVVDNSGTISGYGFYSFIVSTRIETQAVVGKNNVYKINNDTLTLVNKERFTIIAGSDTTYDYGQYILSVLQFPFDIPDNIIGGSSAIQLADKTLTANGEKLLDDVVKVDLGTITVPNTNNNMLDFAGTQAIIHLPHAPSIVLELNYVIGQTIGVYYLLDCYTGTATINITSTKLEGVISSTKVDIGVRVPYMANSYTAPENTGVVAGGDNGVKIPYIELISHDAILPNGFFTIPVVDETIINGLNGYIKVDNVELVTGALGIEKTQIISLLNSGVIIK